MRFNVSFFFLAPFFCDAMVRYTNTEYGMSLKPQGLRITPPPPPIFRQTTIHIDLYNNIRTFVQSIAMLCMRYVYYVYI